ncbi:aldehyde dehydrogenase family protein [Alkalihalobacillus sp. BA299]|uniref:aldehyde dehydrogenase family protein n=1 Tax=Alkalihalobacillus sp. BA299 TaxID=2815938 RepID=UPI0027DC8FE0|nr:aldehyde dehydrogenase family protein [Alkalihalobacillus sp. BA299]
MLVKDNFPSISGMYLINGEWISSSHVKPVINPANIKEVVGEIALCSQDDVNQAVEAASSAFQTWSQTTIEERSNLMLAVASKLEKIISENISLFVRENGKTLIEAKKDLGRCVEIMKKGPDLLKEWWQVQDFSNEHQKVQIRKRPRGVTAIIAPWNSPMILTFKRLVPALLTGNTVVFKPATDCPLTVMNCLKEVAACFPQGVINIVTGSGRVIGDTICSHPKVKAVAFVGSTETGKEIIKNCAPTVKKLSLELGGNDPALVLQDAKLDDEAIRNMRGAVLRAAGQVCSAVKRIYVHQSRYEEFVTKLEKDFHRIVVGNGLHPDTTMGPINNKSQFDFVNDLKNKTIQEGANVVNCGRKLDDESWENGYFMLPSFVTGVKQTSDIVQLEQFGPIVPILPFSDTEEAIHLANDTEFGLRASVWTEDESLAIKLADRIQAGAVFHNNHTIFKDLRLDFPGLKESGLSTETIYGGLEFFTDSYGFAN